MVWPLSATGPNLQQGITHAYTSYPAQLTRVDQGATALKGKLNFAAVDAEGAERIADVTADQCVQPTMTSAWNSVFRRFLRSSFSVGERCSNWRITRSAANPLSRCLQLREDFEGERTVAGFEAYYEKVKDMGAKPASVVQELTTSVIRPPLLVPRMAHLVGGRISTQRSMYLLLLSSFMHHGAAIARCLHRASLVSILTVSHRRSHLPGSCLPPSCTQMYW